MNLNSYLKLVESAHADYNWKYTIQKKEIESIIEKESKTLNDKLEKELRIHFEKTSSKSVGHTSIP